ncbi:hypothetical protein Tco_0655338 [Tanacetum coccineum]|uniref:Uncharacterized protein n=1 Tax=Tanacetum coccineum TaxID=301880 RepID=A0ABQ4X5Q8_9ASTR
MNSIETFLKKFNRLSFRETPKVLLLAWEKFLEIKHGEKQHPHEDIQDLLRKLLEDVRNVNEELAEYINTPSWNRPAFYFDDDDDEEGFFCSWGLREMERGFLNRSSKSKNKKKDIGDSNKKTAPLLSDLAKKIQNIEGKILGKDGKPMQPYRNVNVVESPMVVETLDATRADDGGVVIDVAAGNTNGPNVAEPAFSMGKNGHGVTSVNKEDEGTVKAVTSGTLNTSSMEGTMRDTNSPMNKLEKQKTVVKVATLTNKEKVLGAHVAIPLATFEEISAKFDNTMYGYFIGSWPVSKATQVDGKITSSVNQEGTNEAGNKPSGVPEASSDTPLRDNDKSTYIQDDINIGQLRNNMNRLIEEDKILDINTNLGGNDVTGDKTSLINECSTSTKSVYAKVEGQVKGSDKGSILEQFRKSRENSSNKSISDSDESEVEEVCMPYGISGGGFLDVLEDDLDCFDGYGAQVYDLTEQEQAFCDHYDIRLNSRCRK